MTDRLMVCDECGKIFRVDYAEVGEKEIKCPACEGTNVDSIYKKTNRSER